MSVDLGLVKQEKPVEDTYSLGDKVWLDKNKDGLQTEGEKGVEGVTVKLTGGDLAEAKTTTTDANGKYKFEGLKNGNYTVTFEVPKGYEVTKTDEGTDDKIDSDGKEVSATIKDADNMSVDLGLVKQEAPVEETYELGDRVWLDKNKDGLQTEGEKGVEGVTVKLTGGDLAEAKTTTTDANGKYKFEGLKNGDYKVTFVVSEDYEITKTDEGTDDEKDSDGKEVTATVKDANNMSIDLGLVKKETPTPTPDKPEEPTVPSTPDEPTLPSTPDEPTLPSTPEEPEDTTPLIPLTPAEPVEKVDNDKDVVKHEEEKSEETKETEKIKLPEEVKKENMEQVKVPNRRKTGNPKTGVSSSLGLISTLAASAFAYLGLDDKKRKNK